MKNIAQKIKNIKNEKYCTYSYIHALKKIYLSPSLHCEGLHLIENKNFLEIKYEIK